MTPDQTDSYLLWRGVTLAEVCPSFVSSVSLDYFRSPCFSLPLFFTSNCLHPQIAETHAREHNQKLATNGTKDLWNKFLRHVQQQLVFLSIWGPQFAWHAKSAECSELLIERLLLWIGLKNLGVLCVGLQSY